MNRKESVELSQLRKMIREAINSILENEGLDEVEGDKDGDGDADFADVMMSRMMASGMPKGQAMKKTRKHDK